MQSSGKASVNTVNRRKFIASLLGAWALLGKQIRSNSEAIEMKSSEHAEKVKLCIFSKHLQWLNYEGMAETAAEIGFDGIDLTVRPGGHVAPESVIEDLPKAAEAIRRAGLELPMITTNITDPLDSETEVILRAASQVGVRFYRPGYFKYADSTDIPDTLAEIKPKLRDLAAMNQRYQLHASYQNHAGGNYMGAPLWDLWYLIRELDPRWIGSQFDIRHAVVEGGTSWRIDLRLLLPFVRTVVAKDFRWEKHDGQWKTMNCPIGEGMVDFKQFFAMLKSAQFTGPISVHFEYDLGGAERGARNLSMNKNDVIAAMRKDLLRLKGFIQQA
ncbi:sugar phosphate isomerase/epimerase [candidate division KSB1 bacterium]|nr:sugar phosphate isomerase/epimerase [candidate division KSB1 bacterium]